jgi:CheY-like chemotaxis protein
MKAEQITGAMLNRAIDLYLQHAYRGGSHERPLFDERAAFPQILARQPDLFEDLSGPPVRSDDQTALSSPRVFALRLGNASYPHMKLALVEAFFSNEFVFAVDRHDTFHFDPNVPGYRAWCELKEINRLLKESIEGSWYKEGLPTLRSLREQRFKDNELAGKLRSAGHSVLVLDDDQARAEIMRDVLTRAGYRTVIGPPGPRPSVTETVMMRARRRAHGASLRVPPSAVRDTDDVRGLRDLIVHEAVALIILDVSYRTGQGPRVANALHMDPRSQDIPILGIYSRRDFGPDPDLFDAALRRPYRTEALLEVVKGALTMHGASGSGLHKPIRE